MSEAVSAKRVKPSPQGGLGRPGQLPKSATKRTRILEAAAEVFAERGYAAATLNEIAERAGSQAANLYYYFASREHLVDEVLRYAIGKTSTDIRGLFASMPADATWIEKIEAGLRLHMQTALNARHHGLVYLKVIDQLPDESKQQYVPRNYTTFWDEVFRAAQEAGEVRPDLDVTVFRKLLFGAAGNTLRWYDASEGPSAEFITDQFAKVFVAGLRA